MIEDGEYTDDSLAKELGIISAMLVTLINYPTDTTRQRIIRNIASNTELSEGIRVMLINKINNEPQKDPFEYKFSLNEKK